MFSSCPACKVPESSAHGRPDVPESRRRRRENTLGCGGFPAPAIGMASDQCLDFSTCVGLAIGHSGTADAPACHVVLATCMATPRRKAPTALWRSRSAARFGVDRRKRATAARRSRGSTFLSPSMATERGSSLAARHVGASSDVYSRQRSCSARCVIAPNHWATASGSPLDQCVTRR